jgi:glycosyltransferase involved in cell wall biosynthesis
MKNKSLRSVGILIANFLSERRAAKFSNSIICLTSVDAAMLEKYFSREANYIMPLCIEDKFSSIEGSIKNNLDEYVLFVGGYFYANEHGIRWFIDNVAPHIYADTYVVGRGFERIKATFIEHKKVKIIGEVENLADWYINSDCIVAPIFSGSGMKTKVAEALMYGKKVFATNQALTGYDLSSNSAFTECNNESDFIKAINNHGKQPRKKFYQESREIFLENYSFNSAINRLSKVFNGIEKNFKN